MSTEERNRYLEKIKKLLAIAKDGRGNLQEAETALRQAQALMRKYNIDESEAIGKELEVDGDALMREYASYGKRSAGSKSVKTLPKYTGFIAWGIGKLYDCNTLKVNRYDPITREPLGEFVLFAGYRVDVQVACWTFEYLCECVERGFKNFEVAVKAKDVKKLIEEFGINTWDLDDLYNSTKLERRGGFRRMMALTLQRRLIALKEERDAYMKKEAQTSSSTAGALVVQDRKLQLIREKFGEAEGKTTRAKTTNPASAAGYVEGQRTNLTTNPLQGNQGAMLALK